MGGQSHAEDEGKVNVNTISLLAVMHWCFRKWWFSKHTVNYLTMWPRKYTDEESIPDGIIAWFFSLWPIIIIIMQPRSEIFPLCLCLSLFYLVSMVMTETDSRVSESQYWAWNKWTSRTQYSLFQACIPLFDIC